MCLPSTNFEVLILDHDNYIATIIPAIVLFHFCNVIVHMLYLLLVLLIYLHLAKAAFIFVSIYMLLPFVKLLINIPSTQPKGACRVT